MRDPQIHITLVRAPDDFPVRSPEYQQELRHFEQELGRQGIKVTARWSMQDAAVGGGAWANGEFVVLASTLGPVAIVQLRKLIEAFLKIREGRKLKIKVGATVIEGRVSDLARLISPEQIEKMLEPPKGKS